MRSTPSCHVKISPHKTTTRGILNSTKILYTERKLITELTTNIHSTDTYNAEQYA
jgi:hypothetical protein